MKRREFITVLGTAAAAWPLVTHGQRPKVSRIGWVTTAPSRTSIHFSKHSAPDLPPKGTGVLFTSVLAAMCMK